MLTVLIIIFSIHMQFQKLCKDLSDNCNKMLPLKYWQGFSIHRWQRMKYSFKSKAEIYHALHNLPEEGGAALNFRKSQHRVKIKKFTSILPIPFCQNTCTQLKNPPGKLDPNRYLRILRSFYHKPSTPAIDKGLNELYLVMQMLPIFSKSTQPQL